MKKVFMAIATVAIMAMVAACNNTPKAAEEAAEEATECTCGCDSCANCDSCACCDTAEVVAE